MTTLLSVFLLGSGLLAPGFDRPTRLTDSTRSMVIATRGMVATSQPLAAQAGLDVLRRGGNAVDAAVATAAALNVVEPMSTGIGGDMFAIAWIEKEKKLVGLNGSGRSSRHATLEYYRDKGLEKFPLYSADSVTVPGALDGWITLHEKYGRLPLGEVLRDAIRYAEEGFPVSEIIASSWKGHERFQTDADFAKTYLLPDGEGKYRAPRLGEIFRTPDLAKTFRAVAEKGRDVFYRGEIAKKIAACLEERGSLIDAEDLAAHRSMWVEPVSSRFRGHDVFELPPNGQGITALQMLNVLEGYDLEAMGHNSPDHLHYLLEAKKLAFADRDTFIADPDRRPLPIETLISPGYAAKLRKRIDPARASVNPPSVLAESHDTVYLATADSEGNMVSFINSIFHGFGSHVVVPGTGICLQNRGALFSLDPDHLNRIEPSKLPFHTIIPGFVMRGGEPHMAFGVMGGDFQPQGHTQVLINHLVFGMNPQEMGEAPRVAEVRGQVHVESGVPEKTREALRERGHDVVQRVGSYGGYQAIQVVRDASGRRIYLGGSDNRKDGCVVGY